MVSNSECFIPNSKLDRRENDAMQREINLLVNTIDVTAKRF